MSRGTFYLHVGPPKTGTTAVQGVLRGGGAAGLTYPQTGQWSDGAHHKLVFALAGARKRGDTDIPPIDDLSAPLIKELEAAEGDVLISSELFEPDTSGRAFLERFGPAIAERFDRIVIVIAVRDPLERAASFYNQDVKDPVVGETRAPDLYLLEKPLRFALMPLIDRWSQFSAQLLVINYHPAASFVSRFLKSLGHGDVAFAESTWQNRSMSGKSVLALLAANRLLTEMKDREAFFASLRNDAAFRVWKGASFPFSAPATESFERVLRPDMDALRRESGVDLVSAHRAPPPRFTLSHEEVRQIWHHLDKLPGIDALREEMEELIDGFRASVPA